MILLFRLLPVEKMMSGRGNNPISWRRGVLRKIEPPVRFPRTLWHACFSGFQRYLNFDGVFQLLPCSPTIKRRAVLGLGRVVALVDSPIYDTCVVGAITITAITAIFRGERKI